MSGVTSDPIQIARDAWGDAMPDWIRGMAEECAATSGNKVAKKLGRSGAMISQALSNKYPADLGPLEELFNGVFRNLAVECPALGTIPANECQHWRRKAGKFVNVNSLRVQMYRACNGCHRNRKETGHG